MAICSQCERAEELTKTGIRRIRLNSRGLCAACVCANSEAAVALGRLGGRVKSAAKAAAARENGKRPKRKKQSVIR